MYMVHVKTLFQQVCRTKNPDEDINILIRTMKSLWFSSLVYTQTCHTQGSFVGEQQPSVVARFGSVMHAGRPKNQVLYSQTSQLTGELTQCCFLFYMEEISPGGFLSHSCLPDIHFWDKTCYKSLQSLRS